jgi:hypothetical protein
MHLGNLARFVSWEFQLLNGIITNDKHLPSQMGVHLELDSDKRFQPWGISMVDEMTSLPLQEKAGQEQGLERE